MAKLDERHLSPNPEDRKIKKHYHPIYQYSAKNDEEFDRVEMVLDEVTCDFVNGVTTTEILIKLEDGLYNSQKKGLSHKMALTYVGAVRKRLAANREKDSEQMKDLLFNQYQQLYRECIEIGNHIGAKGALDSVAKLMGLTDKPNSNNLQINTDKESVTINFGFEEDKE